MEYIKLNKNFIFSSIFRYLHKYLCFHAGNSRYIAYVVLVWTRVLPQGNRRRY